MPQQIADLLERRVGGEVVDVVSAVREDALLAIEIADPRCRGDDVLEPASLFLRSSHAVILPSSFDGGQDDPDP
jgi:hypothetical protein